MKKECKRIMNNTVFIIGIIMFILGFFDLQRTRFGYASMIMMYGLIIMMYVNLIDKVEKIESAITKRD